MRCRKECVLLFFPLLVWLCLEKCGAQTSFVSAGPSAPSFSAGPVFIENKGQWPAPVRYLARTEGMNAWVTDSGIVYDFYSLVARGEDKRSSPPGLLSVLPPGLAPERLEQPESAGFRGHVVRMRFADAAGRAVADAGTRRRGHHNYLIGDDPAKWGRGAALYGSVSLQELYPGVAAVLYFDGGSLRYDLHVAAGKDPGGIRMKMEGAGEVTVNGNGELVLKTSLGEVHHGSILAYQDIGGERKRVECGFRQEKSGELAFSLGSYDRRYPLVIDPLVYATFLSGTDYGSGGGLAVDGSGNVYVTGRATNGTYPTTVGAYDTTFDPIGGDNTDIVVTKLNDAGTEALYSTFVGGRYGEAGSSIAIDSARNVYVLGWTSSGRGSNDFPVTPGAFDTTPPRDVSWSLNDLVVFKLDSSGSELLYSTYLGGLYNEWSGGIAIDVDGNAYITGQTSSRDFPKTDGAFQQVPAENSVDFVWEAFVTKLNADGSDLVYSTYLGGERYDWGVDIAVDAQGNAYVTGETTSWEFPTTPGAYDRLFEEGVSWENYDVFVAKFDPTGSRLIYSTFIGETQSDRARGIAVDAQGNAYVTGITESSRFPVTPGALDRRFSGESDGFVLKLNPTGSALIYSTYLGGDWDESMYEIALHEGRNAVVVGTTTSENYRTTAGAFSRAYSGDNQTDVILAVLNETGSGLLYSTFLGARGQDIAADVAVGSGGDVYVGGYTYAAGFPSTPGAYDPVPPSHPERPKMFVARFRPSCGLNVRLGADISICAGSSLELTTEVTDGVAPFSFSWSPAQGLNKINEANPIATPAATTQYVVTVTDGGGCVARDTINIVVLDPPGAFAGADTTICSGGTALLGAETSGNGAQGLAYSWQPSDGLSDPTSPRTLAAPTETQLYILTVTDEKGCRSIDSVRVTVFRPIAVALSGGGEICAGEETAIRAEASGGAGKYIYQWEPADGLSRTDVPDPLAAPLTTTAYRVRVTDSAGCSVLSDPLTVTVRPQPTPTISISGTAALCPGESVTLDAGDGYTAYRWSGGETTRTITVAAAGFYSVEVTGANGCVGRSDTVQIRSGRLPDVDIAGPVAVCAEGSGVYTVRADAEAEYEWTLQSASGSIESGAGTNRIVVRWGSPETALLQLIARNSVSGCADTGFYEVEVGASLKPVIRGPQESAILCAGESVELDAGEGYASYRWSTGEVTRTIVVDRTMDVSVTVTDAEGCGGTSDPYSVTVKSAPRVALSQGGVLRLCPDGEQWLSAPPGFASYEWSTGETAPSIAVSAGGEYWVRAVDDDGCVGMSDTLVVLPSEDFPAVVPDGDLALCEGESVRLSASPGYIAYEWSTGETTPSITVSAPGYYRVTVTAAGGCVRSSAAIGVTVSPRPATPAIVRNGDTLTASPADAYQWLRDGAEIPAATGASYVIDRGGAYAVRTFNAAGCFAESAQMAVERRRVVWLDTIGGAVGDRLWLTMYVDPPLLASEGVTGFRARLQLAPEALYPHSAERGADGAMAGDKAAIRYDNKGGVSVWSLPGGRLEGGRLFRLELEGLVTGHPVNFVRIDSLVLDGLGEIPALAEGVVTLTGCEVDRRFSKSVRIFSVVPNPGDEEVSVTYRAPEGMRLNLRLLDPLGRVVKVRGLQPASGEEENIRVDLNELPAGLYMLELRDREEVFAVPLLVR